MLRAMPGFEDKIDEIVVNNRQQYATHLVHHTYLYPGVEDGLKALRALGCKMAVTSNKTSCLIPQILEQLGIAQYFDVRDATFIPLKNIPLTVFTSYSINPFFIISLS